jgi:hypothetical protein
MTGIDKALRDRVNTYGTNPAALQQRYQQSQKLIDLLALQQVKSDMQNAKNNIMASMQNNPNTIAAQRQNEVLGMARQNVADKVQATAGALNNKQRQQQAQMKKLMQLANRLGPAGISSLLNRRPQQPRPQQPSPQPNPMMAGISRAPAPNMQGIKKAAQGGIIGFQNTGYVPDLSMIPEENRGALLQLLEGKSKEMQDTIIQNYIKNISPGLPYPPEPELPMPDLSSTFPNLMSRNQAKNYIQSIISGTGSNEQKQAAINSFLQKNAANPPVGPNISGVTTDIIESTDTGTMAGAVGSAVKKSIGSDPLGEDAIRKGFQLSDELAGLSNEQKLEMKNLYTGLGDLMKAQLDPARLRRDKLRSQLIGAAGKGDSGIMGAGIMRGTQTAESQQDKAAQSLLGAKIDTFRNLSSDIQDDKRKSLDFSRTVGESKLGQQTQAILVGAGLTEYQLNSLSTDATNFYKNKEIDANSALGQARILAEKAITEANNDVKVQIAEIHAAVSEANNKLVQETNQLIKEQDTDTRRLQIGIDAITRMTAERSDRITALENMYKPLIEMAQTKFTSVRGDSPKKVTLRENYETELLELQTDLQKQKDNLTKSFDLQIKAIEAKIQGIQVQ